MKDDVRTTIYATIVLFLVVVAAWLSLIYVSACGLTFSCVQAAPRVDRTPIPTLIPAAHEAAAPGQGATLELTGCPVLAADLVGAWVTAGSPETEAFPFTDTGGHTCQGTFADIQPLFHENNLWEHRTIGCVSCHNADLTERSGGLDLTSYAAILGGSGRQPGQTNPGNDILGGGDWNASALHTVLVTQGFSAEGHSPDQPPSKLLVYAGQAAQVTATPTP